MRATTIACAVSLILSSYIGLSTQQSVPAGCPTAPALKANENPSLFFWRTVTDEQINQDPNGGTSPAVFITSEIKKSFDPLNGSGVNRRKTCSKLFLVDAASNKVAVEKDVSVGALSANELRPQLQYVLARNLKETSLDTLKISTGSGERKLLASVPYKKGSCQSSDAFATASPSGVLYALLKISSGCGSTPQPASVEVTFFSGQNDTVVSNNKTGIFTFNTIPWTQWSSDKSFTISDDTSSQVFSF